MDKKNSGILCAILAAAFYALSAPFSKILLNYIPETLTAGFLYLGAGICMLLIAPLRKNKKEAKEENHLTRKELPYTVAMILLDIAFRLQGAHQPAALGRNTLYYSLLRGAFRR